MGVGRKYTFPQLSIIKPSAKQRLAEGSLNPRKPLQAIAETWNTRYSLPGKLRLPVMVSSVMR